VIFITLDKGDNLETNSSGEMEERKEQTPARQPMHITSRNPTQPLSFRNAIIKNKEEKKKP
jgi:hypothetical protein